MTRQEEKEIDRVAKEAEREEEQALRNAAIDVTVGVLYKIPEIHDRSCAWDDRGRPDFNCTCLIKDIVKKLLARKKV